MLIHPQAEIIAPKVKYEWDMFRWMASRIQNEYQSSPQENRNLLMEDFLLHARVLRDFFVATPKQDDVSATHFFDDPSLWQQTAKELCSYLRANRVRLNKKLAHLTYSRLTEDEKWDFEAIRKEIFVAWESFLSNLPESAKSWFS